MIQCVWVQAAIAKVMHSGSAHITYLSKYFPIFIVFFFFNILCVLNVFIRVLDIQQLPQPQPL